MKHHRRVLNLTLAEETTVVFVIPLLDHLGAPIDPAGVATIVLTVYDQASGSIINAKDAVSILNTNGGVLDADGVLTLELAPADNVLANPTDYHREIHVALIEWTFGPGATRAGAVELVFKVQNITQRP